MYKKLSWVMRASLAPVHPRLHLLGALSHRRDQSRTARVLPRHEKHLAAEGFEAVGPLLARRKCSSTQLQTFSYIAHA